VIRFLRENAKYVGAIIGLAVIAGVVGGYILNKQRLRFPLIEEKPVRMVAVFEEANAATPGQGQAVSVAGVDIGAIADVDLVDGRAHVGIDIEPKYVEEGLIRQDAKALLRPRTNLNDMYIQVLPGSRDEPPAREGYTIPVSNTMPDVDLDQILSTLTPRVRDYLALFIEGAGTGLRGRGDELAEVFRRFGPTMRDLARVNRSVARERKELRQLITSLADLNEGLAEKPEDLTELVSASEATFSAFASEDDNLRETVSELPETLRVTRQALEDVEPFARELGPATRALLPVTQALGEASPAVRRLATEATPLVQNRIRPFVREARPLVRELEPAAQATFKSFTELLRSAFVLNQFVNLLGHNPEGREAPEQRNREEGYLFWLAWAAHQGLNLINVDDANGPMRPLFLTGTCTTLTDLVTNQPDLEFGMNLSPILSTLCRNPDTPSVRADRAEEIAKRYVRGTK
jgi:phospholipid/cholesterol/gamma-HCH transport system substrate-binding protein